MTTPPMSSDMTPVSQENPPDAEGFGSLATAAALRDVMTKHVKKVMNQVAPQSKRGRVVDIDFVGYTAQVWFVGDATPTKVKLFTSTVPGLWGTKYGPVDGDTSVMGKGSQVLVQNFFGTPYVTEVLTGGQFSSDWSMAGEQTVVYGQNGLPEFNRGSEYVFRPRWPSMTDPTVPGRGGPFAINIGPFIRDKNVDALNGINDRTEVYNGTFDIDIVSTNGNKRYQFTVDPIRIAGLQDIRFGVVGVNGYGGSINAWMRLLSNQTSNDPHFAQSSNINTTWKFALTDPNPPHAVTPTLGGWNNAADTQTTVSLYTGTVPGTSGGYMQVQSNASHATLKVRESDHFPLPQNGNEVDITAQVYPTVTTTDVRVGIDWYDVNDTFLSTNVGVANNCPANTMTIVVYNNSAHLYAPAGAVYGRAYLQINGTPATSTIFYVGAVQVADFGNNYYTSWDLDIGYRQTIHGSLDNSVANSPGEIWFRVYLYWLGPGNADPYGNQFTDFTWTVRVRNDNSFLKAQSNKTGLVVYEYDTAPVDVIGILGVTNTRSGPSNSAIFSNAGASNDFANVGAWRNPELMLAHRAAQTLVCSGSVSYLSGNFAWTGAFEFSGASRTRLGLLNSYGTIAMPPNGTTVYTGPGSGVTGASFTASGIAIAAGQSLWYVPPFGAKNVALPNTSFNNTTIDQAGAFALIDFVNNPDYYSVPEWWIFIAYRPATDATLRCADGNLYGGNINVGDSGTSVSIPGAASLGNEVYGLVTVTPGTGGTAPIGSVTVSYSSLSGSGSVPNVQVSGQTTVPGTTFGGCSANLSTRTSTIIYANRSSGTQPIWYRILNTP